MGRVSAQDAALCTSARFNAFRVRPIAVVMRIEIHVKTLDEADAARERYAGSNDDVVIIVDQPVAAPVVERQERRQAIGGER